jgi:hypothetical protein
VARFRFRVISALSPGADSPLPWTTDENQWVGDVFCAEFGSISDDGSVAERSADRVLRASSAGSDQIRSGCGPVFAQGAVVVVVVDAAERR